MKRTRIVPNLSDFPAELYPLLQKYPVFDSSCSAAARVWFLDGQGGLYLKSAPAGSLKTEADMTAYFHSKGLGPQVLDYRTENADWLLTRAVPGEDCTFRPYLEDPKRLCDTLAPLLRQLHDTNPSGCPVPNHTARYRARAEENHAKGLCDLNLFPNEGWGFSSAEEAWAEVCRNGMYLKNDTLLHGDYCLPNIMLDNWRFSGFIDLDSGGVGDRHVDLFWGVWTLFFNLKTNQFYHRFLDAYGRDAVEEEALRTITAFEIFG